MSYPLAQSFEKRLKLYKKFKFLGFGLLAVLAVFVPWDVYFTIQNVWWFNADYITGIKLFYLPIEEILFFVLIPFACVFIYEVLNYFVKQDVFKRGARYFFLMLTLLLMCFALIFKDNTYTSICFGLTSITTVLLWRFNPSWIGRFLLAYLVSLIPFLLINGILTGSFILSPIVNYNPDDIIGFRVFTIPIEDFVYNLMMFLIMIAVYEKSSSAYQLKS